MAAFLSSVAWSVVRTAAWSYSKLIMAARSAATARARSEASRASRSRSRRSRSALSSTGAGVVGAGAAVGSGAGCSGAGFPPQAAASPAVARTNNREVARIRTPRSGLGSDRGPTQSAGPRREARGTRGLQLAYAAGFDVDDPELPDAAPVGDERDVSAVGSPRRIFVPAGGRGLPDPPSRHIDEKELRTAGHFAMEHDVGSVRGPFRCVGAAGRAIVERRQQLLIGPVGGHDVDLGRSRTRRNEC